MPDEMPNEEKNVAPDKGAEKRKVKTKPPKKKESATETAPATPPSPGLKHLLRIGIAIVLVVLLILGAFVLTRFVLLPTYQAYRVKKELAKDLAPAKKESPKPAKKKLEMGVIYEIKDITVNTYGSEGRRYAVLEIALETHEPKVIEELKGRDPQVRDLLISYLRTRTAEQILDIDFQEVSRKELTELINQRLTSGKVDSLYYTMLVVQ